nr:hypothetical protein [Tanacetum cinerariifolium]
MMISNLFLHLLSPNEDSDSFMEEIDLFLTPDDPMPPSIEDDEDSEGDILFLEKLLHDDPIPLPDTLDFSYEVRIFLPFFTYPAEASVIISIPPLVGGVADVVVEIKGTGWSISITFRFSVGLQTPDDLSRSRLGFIEKMGVHG